MFPILTDTLKKVKTTRPLLIGDHLTSSLEVGDALPVSHRDYNPRLGDTPFDIDPFDTSSNPRQVTLSVSRSPLSINILNGNLESSIRQNITGKNYLDDLERARIDLAGHIADVISSIRTGSIGRTKMYNQTNYSYAPQNPTFVVDNSKFETFSPDNLKPNLKKYIGLRVLYALEVEVPSNIGIFQTGIRELPHLDTSKKKELQKFNDKLKLTDETRKQAIFRNWERAGGIALVDVVYNPINDLDFSSLDKQISLTVAKEWL